jgi:uncharacterized protein YdiU (UPF0061 family)
MILNLKDTFNKELPADRNTDNTRRQVFDSAFSYVTPRIPSAPKLVHASRSVANLIGIGPKDIQSEEFLKVFSGAKIIENTDPYAMCYGGHQFGNWAGQLGDGRAINLTEVIHKNHRWALQLKGAGETPYSRTADGLAVLRSSIREHLCSEAMFHLGVPTTRSLSLMLTGDQVMRDILYDGNADYEKGAVVCRVSPSFIRFGNFQILAARKDLKTLTALTDYTIRHFFPTIKSTGKESYIEFFNEVVNRTLKMIVHWQRVGFVHGVMNTDNLSILGLTIDYGPYGWLEGYDLDWTPNTTDREQKRYRFGNQPRVALWNLMQLANAIYPLVNEAPPFQNALDHFQEKYDEKYLEMMESKLGLEKRENINQILINQLQENLLLTETDMTIFFRNLAYIKKDTKIDSEGNFLGSIKEAFYQPEELKGKTMEAWIDWFINYKEKICNDSLSDGERKVKMNEVNPKYVLRNYMAQLAIDAANRNNYSIVKELFELLENPYEEQIENEKWFVKRPEWAKHKIGCSMLSCSS